MTTVPSLTAYVAKFITDTQARDIPADVMHLAKRSILDGVGLALAGNAAESGHIVRSYFRTFGCPTDKGCTVIGTNLKVPARFAAFANGIAIHADDYDDTQLAVAKDRVYGLLTHPTAPALPPVLALGELGNRSGLDVLTAYQIAVEVETKVAEAINPRHYDHGFHSTATIGTIGATAGAAKLLGLNPEQTQRAIGIGASQAAGLRENFGTMTKPFHPGRSCESGVVAAEFAKLGWTATPFVLEANRGFFMAAGGGYDAAAIEGKLGNPWTFAFPGVSIKPHPSGSLTHPGMGKMLSLIREHDIRPEQVVRIKVGTNRHMPNALIHRRPKNELQAKFSMEFCMAILLLERKAGLAEFTDKVVNRPDVQKMIEKVEFGVHPEAEAAGYEKMTTIIEIELNDGRKISGRADFGKGSPDNPMSDRELADKFLECAAWGKLSRANADNVVELVFGLEKLKSIRELTRLLAAGAKPAAKAKARKTMPRKMVKAKHRK
ncbi:MAG: MmgE/PrpD family protein [Betaproteobacteria bacterium RIFCSPLOWO2_12_FULL_62_58]|nr:MAG: MmgE/PrpD family protein [Betaproteobacteria bacterium RIFCSPLOWO2_12_FULL_62_58]